MELDLRPVGTQWEWEKTCGVSGRHGGLGKPGADGPGPVLVPKGFPLPLGIPALLNDQNIHLIAALERLGRGGHYKVKPFCFNSYHDMQL